MTDEIPPTLRSMPDPRDLARCEDGPPSTIRMPRCVQTDLLRTETVVADAVRSWGAPEIPPGPEDRASTLRRQLAGCDYAKLEAMTLEQLLKSNPGARVTAHVHDEWLIELPGKSPESA
jgi:hypothetical protein